MQRLCEQCGKQGYFWEREAKQVRRKIREQGRGNMNQYYCPYGNGIHLTGREYKPELKHDRTRIEQSVRRGIRDSPRSKGKGSPRPS